MVSNLGFLLVFLAALLLVGSDGVLEVDGGSTGRRLLQVKQKCPVNLEVKNYTIVTSKCKGPQYPPSLCCSAFREFACPIAQYLNDESNDCSSVMFSYLNLYGNYPAGLFGSECRDDMEGISCNGISENGTVSAGGALRAQSNSLALTALASGLVALLLH